MLANACKYFWYHFITKSDWQPVVIRDKGRPLNESGCGQHILLLSETKLTVRQHRKKTADVGILPCALRDVKSGDIHDCLVSAHLDCDMGRTIHLGAKKCHPSTFEVMPCDVMGVTTE
jgi:hypothetical protein